MDDPRDPQVLKQSLRGAAPLTQFVSQLHQMAKSEGIPNEVLVGGARS